MLEELFVFKIFLQPRVTEQSVWNLEIGTCVIRQRTENLPSKPATPLDLVENSESFEHLSEVSILNIKY